MFDDQFLSSKLSILQWEHREHWNTGEQGYIVKSLLGTFNKGIKDHHFEMTDYITSGVASPTIQSRCANIAMFINYQHNQFLKK